MSKPEQLIGMKAICGYVNRSESTVINWIRDMDFPATKIGGIYEAEKDEINTWRKRLANGLPPKSPAPSNGKKKKIETLV